jgi:formylglycine-generating enzyme required for sulfatase activity
MIVKAENTKSVPRNLRIMLVVMSATLILIPFYLPIEAQKQNATAVSSTNTQPVSPDAKIERNREIQTYTETIKRVGIEMVRIPSGKFTMGSPSEEKDRNPDEGPQHEVTISSFFMGKYEVTQLQWRAVAVLPKVGIDLPLNPSMFKGDNLPIEQLTWNQAIEFCERLSIATGKRYRLPTEAEWEYACRGMTTGMYAGNLDALAWHGNNSGSTTHPVGTKKANLFGLYDMHGNVWEWCSDRFARYPSGDAQDPQGPGTGSMRVLRGGSFHYGAMNLRSASRGGSAPDRQDQRGELGFRIASTIR